MPSYSGFEMNPIPDETFFGLVVTAGSLTGFETYYSAYTGILGEWNTCPSSLLPRGLKRLADFLPPEYHENPDALCLRHTALPYFQHFCQPESFIKAKDAMLNEQRLNVRSIVSLANRPTQDDRYLKYCTACATEQWEISKRSTWLRSHQLPGVEVCHKHGLTLVKSAIPTVKYGLHSDTIQFPPKSEDLQSHKLWTPAEPWESTSPNRLIAQISHELLTNPPDMDNQHIRARAYRAAFISAGYGKGNIVNWIKVQEALRNKYGDLLPRKLGLSFEINNYSHWLHKITSYRGSVQNPLQHILLIGAMFSSLEELYEAMKTESRKTSLKSTSLPAILNPMSDSSISAEEKLSSPAESCTIDQQRLDSHRHALSRIRAMNPQATRTELKSILGIRSYKWILRNDRKWAETALPQKISKRGIIKASQPISDWTALDNKLALEVTKISPHDLFRTNKGKTEINNAEIARQSNFSYFQVRKIISLPKTQVVLNIARELNSHSIMSM